MKQPILRKQGIPFTQVANVVLNDPKLSLKAKGLFTYLYSKPPAWNYSLHRMVRDMKEGKRAIMMALRELEGTGYLLRSRLYGGRMEYLMRHDPKFEDDCQDNQNTDCSFSNKLKKQHAKTATVSNIVLESNKEEESNKERGEINSPSFGISKILSKEKYSPYLGSPMDYFRDEAKRRYRLRYLEREDERNDPKIRKQIKAMGDVLGDEMRSFIDWWFDGTGAWCNYAPEACFMIRTYSWYENREVITRNKRRGKWPVVRAI